jgi:membrane associated rhomboid family serine protease
LSESGEQRDGGRSEERRESSAKSFLATIACVVGIVLAVGAAIGALVGAGASGVVSAGAVGVGLGVLGYLMGASRLGTATIVVSIAALFLGLAATQGLIPGIGASDRDLPPVEPRGGGE